MRGHIDVSHVSQVRRLSYVAGDGPTTRLETIEEAIFFT